MPNKKADMSIALIVSAVIALIILVVVLVIFGKGAGESAKTLQSCEGRGGHCTSDIICPKEESTIPNVQCEDDAQRCCREF